MNRFSFSSFLFFVFYSCLSQAVVAYDNSAFVRDFSVSTTSYSLTVGTGTNRQLVVFVALSTDCTTSPAVTSITYAGVGLTRISTHNGFACGGFPTLLEIWAMPPGTSPASGANNVVLNFSITPGNTIHSGAISVTGVDQTTTFTSTAINSFGVGSPISVTLPSSGANDLVASFAYNGTSVTSPGAPQTQLWLNNFSVNYSADNTSGATAPGGTTGISWNVNSTDGSSGIAAVSFKAAPPAKIKHKVISN